MIAGNKDNQSQTNSPSVASAIEKKEEVSKDPEYLAAEGKEDRHGEMTGAISINMIFCGIIVVAWGIIIGPLIFESVWPIAGIAILLGITCPFIFLKLSQKLWAKLSKIAETFELD